MMHFSTIGWHPKKPDYYVYGTSTGIIGVCHKETINETARYTVPLKIKGQRFSGMVQDIVHSPGEDVFLAIRSDGQIFLFSGESEMPSMQFET